MIFALMWGVPKVSMVGHATCLLGAWTSEWHLNGFFWAITNHEVPGNCLKLCKWSNCDPFFPKAFFLFGFTCIQCPRRVFAALATSLGLNRKRYMGKLESSDQRKKHEIVTATQLRRIVGFKTVSACRSVNCSLASCCPDGSWWPRLTMKHLLSRFEVENLEVFAILWDLVITFTFRCKIAVFGGMNRWVLDKSWQVLWFEILSAHQGHVLQPQQVPCVLYPKKKIAQARGTVRGFQKKTGRDTKLQRSAVVEVKAQPLENTQLQSLAWHRSLGDPMRRLTVSVCRFDF